MHKHTETHTCVTPFNKEDKPSDLIDDGHGDTRVNIAVHSMESASPTRVVYIYIYIHISAYDGAAIKDLHKITMSNPTRLQPFIPLMSTGQPSALGDAGPAVNLEEPSHEFLLF